MKTLAELWEMIVEMLEDDNLHIFVADDKLKKEIKKVVAKCHRKGYDAFNTYETVVSYIESLDD